MATKKRVIRDPHKTKCLFCKKDIDLSEGNFDASVRGMDSDGNGFVGQGFSCKQCADKIIRGMG